MRRFLISLIIILFSLNSFGQNQIENSQLLKLNETDSIYLIAIEKYLDQLEYEHSVSLNSKYKRTVFINYEGYLNRIPKKINGFAIKMIGEKNRRKVFKQNDRKLELLEVSSLMIENGKFKISIIPYNAKLKRSNSLELMMSEWTNIYFDFKNDRLIYSDTKTGGI